MGDMTLKLDIVYNEGILKKLKKGKIIISGLIKFLKVQKLNPIFSVSPKNFVFFFPFQEIFI